MKRFSRYGTIEQLTLMGRVQPNPARTASARLSRQVAPSASSASESEGAGLSSRGLTSDTDGGGGGSTDIGEDELDEAALSDPGHRSAYAFIRFATAEAACLAIDAEHGRPFLGRALRIQFCESDTMKRSKKAAVAASVAAPAVVANGGTPVPGLMAMPPPAGTRGLHEGRRSSRARFLPPPTTACNGPGLLETPPIHVLYAAAPPTAASGAGGVGSAAMLGPPILYPVGVAFAQPPSAPPPPPPPLHRRAVPLSGFAAPRQWGGPYLANEDGTGDCEAAADANGWQQVRGSHGANRRATSVSSPCWQPECRDNEGNANGVPAGHWDRHQHRRSSAREVTADGPPPAVTEELAPTAGSQSPPLPELLLSAPVPSLTWTPPPDAARASSPCSAATSWVRHTNDSDAGVGCRSPYVSVSGSEDDTLSVTVTRATAAWSPVTTWEMSAPEGSSMPSVPIASTLPPPSLPPPSPAQRPRRPPPPGFSLPPVLAAASTATGPADAAPGAPSALLAPPSAAEPTGPSVALIDAAVSVPIATDSEAKPQTPDQSATPQDDSSTAVEVVIVDKAAPTTPAMPRRPAATGAWWLAQPHPQLPLLAPFPWWRPRRGGYVEGVPRWRRSSRAGDDGDADDEREYGYYQDCAWPTAALMLGPPLMPVPVTARTALMPLSSAHAWLPPYGGRARSGSKRPSGANARGQCAAAAVRRSEDTSCPDDDYADEDTDDTGIVPISYTHVEAGEGDDTPLVWWGRRQVPAGHRAGTQGRFMQHANSPTVTEPSTDDENEGNVPVIVLSS